MKALTIIKGAGKEGGMELRDPIAERVAAAIREKSAAAQLISASEIMGLLNDENLALPDADKTGEDITAILTRLVNEYADLHELSGTGAPCYYSSAHMTEAYAQILFHKLDGPLRLIAETVRQNSGEYQRPVALEIFTQPPFNLAYHQILDYLAMMAQTEGYDDIVTTSTSASGIYLYSTTHLEKEYAVMLAEWLDVGQAHNP